jgi:putative hydrolase of the HAD superfamily
MTPPEAVTFDFWNTLVGEDPVAFEYRREQLRELLGSRGEGLSDEQVNAAFEHAWQAYVKAWKGNQPFGARDAVPVMLARLGIEDPDDALVAAVVDSIERPVGDRRPPLAPNIAGTLEVLRSAGVRLGIICDVGLTPSVELRRWLDAHGVLRFFDHWSFSDEVGVFKPDPVIFNHALAGIGAARGGAPVDPGRAAHVGDLRRTDIAGALAMGMTAVRYKGVADDPEPTDGSEVVEAQLVIDDHADLPELLGLA